MSATALQLKTCEWCGRNFLREIPKSAREGKKICDACEKNPPQEDDDEATQIAESYRLLGVKLRG